MGSKERSIGRAAVLLPLEGAIIAASIIITDCHQKDSSGDSATNFEDNRHCVRVERTDTHITSVARLSRDEVKTLPSPLPPDIICGVVELKGPTIHIR